MSTPTTREMTPVEKTIYDALVAHLKAEYPNEGSEFTYPSKTGVQLVVANGGTLQDVIKAWDARVKSFGSTYLSAEHGLDVSIGLSWTPAGRARMQTPAEKILASHITVSGPYESALRQKLVDANSALKAAGLPAQEIPADPFMGPSGQRD